MQEEVAQARQARAELAKLQALRKQARPGSPQGSAVPGRSSPGSVLNYSSFHSSVPVVQHAHSLFVTSSQGLHTACFAVRCQAVGAA